MSIFVYNFYAPILNDLLDFMATQMNDYYTVEDDYETASRFYQNKAML